MKIKKWSFCFPLGLLLFGFYTCPSYADAPTYTVTNNSSFYFIPQSSECPEIDPGKTAQVTGYCDYLVCATSQGAKDHGCEELVGDGSGNLTAGGYLAYVGVSTWKRSCSFSASWLPYLCNWHSGVKNTHTVALDFSYETSKPQFYSAGSKMREKVSLGKISTYSSGPALRGINISGLEYDGTFLDALYQRPDLPDMLYFSALGMNTVRLPIRWEFLLSISGNSVESVDPMSKIFNEMYMAAVYDTVQKYLASGLTVVLDLHNYMRFCPTGAAFGQGNEPTNAGKSNNLCQLVNADQLSYIWGVIATKFSVLAKQYPNQLVFELMNEPFSVDNTTTQNLKINDLFNAEVAAVHTIRNHGLSNLILLSGDYWDPLHGWVNQSPDPNDLPNGVVFTAANLKAAGVNVSNIAMDMHQYFDFNWSGTHQTCQQFTSYTDFKQKLGLENNKGVDIFGNWQKANSMKVFLGEFGAADNAICRQDINYMMKYVSEHAYSPQAPQKGGFIGWAAWRANKHGYTGFGAFNFLQAENDDVYGGNDTHQYKIGLGIAPGLGNKLMQYLQPPQAIK